MPSSGHLEAPDIPARRDHRVRRWLSWIATISVLILLIPFILHAGDEMIQLEGWIGDLGILGPITFILAVVIFTSLFVPSSLFSASAGALFGLGWGTLYMSIGLIIAAALNYLIAHRMLRGPINRFLANHPKLLAIQRAVQHEGAGFQIMLRLAPLNPASVNCTLGATGVPFPSYMIASLGLIPGAFAEVYFGHVAAHLSKVAASGHPHSPTHTMLTVAGMLAALGFMFVIGRMAKRAIDKAETETDA